jgi:hypothetical protein
MYSTSHRRYAITQRWNSPLFRNLSPFEKCVYSYLWDNCDLAGFYEIDHSTIEHYNKIPSNEIESILENLSKNEITISNGWLFILDFIEYQGNGNLSPNNNAHKAIISSLSKNMIHFKECLRTQNNLAPYEGLVRGSSKSNCLGKSISNGNDESKVLRIESNDSKSYKENKPIEKLNLPSSNRTIKIRYMKKGKPCDFCSAKEYDLCKIEKCRAKDDDVFKEIIK